MVFHLQNNTELTFQLLGILCALSGITAIASFAAFVRARMKFDEQHEKRYQQIHFISLFVFVFLGVLLLVMLGDRSQ